MKLTRRQLLALGGTVILSGSGYCYLDNEKMESAPTKEGKVLCDLHTHPPNYKSLEETLEALSSPGLVGLSHVITTKRNLIYEEAIKLCSGHSEFKELVPGKLAKIKEGYFLRTQELEGGIHDILAIGCEGDYLPDFKDGRKAVEEIHKKGGIAILCHPYVVSGGLMFRLANSKEEEKIKEICEIVDEVEVHNAQTINLIPAIAWMKKANRKANQVIENYSHLKGVANSDAHRRLEQLKICGNYINRELIENEGVGGLTSAIKSSNFERYGDSEAGPYVSRWNWFVGMIYEQKFGGK